MRCCTYACMQHGQRTEKELKSQLPGDKIGIGHKNPEVGVVGAVGWVGRQTIPVRRLFSCKVQYCTV